MHEKYHGRGLRLLALTRERGQRLDDFLTSNGIRYSVGSGSPSASAYGVRGIPMKFLIDVDGKVAAKGNFLNQIGGEAAIERCLERVLRYPPGDYSERFEGVLRELRAERYGEALDALESVERDRRATDEDRSNAKKLREWLEGVIEGLLAKAEEADPLEARDLLERACELFDGSEHEREAKKRLRRLVSKNRDLFKADKYLKAGLELEQQKRYSQAFRAYVQAARKGHGTSVGEEAERRARALQESGKVR